MRPFLKWAGGKRRLASVIEERLLSRPARRLVEPFVGSAAVSLALHDQVETLVLNDANEDLVAVYRHLAKDSDRFREAVRAWFVPENNEEDAYYALRDRFNEAAKGSLERASLLIYLNRHGYNGLCRYNASGGYNVPFGRYVRPMCPDAALAQAAEALAGSTLTAGDFEPVIDGCGEGDAVYCDPPYVPLTRTAAFTDYAAGGFSSDDQRRLAHAAKRAAQRGAVVVVSNHDTPETQALYEDASLTFLDVRRTISRDAATRGLTKELLAVYAPPQAKRKRANRA